MAGFGTDCVQTNVEDEQMITRPLGASGLFVPELALGTAPFGSAYREISQDEADLTVVAALDAGVDLFDTAPHYGDSEVVLGRALSGIDRGRFQLSTKVGRYGDAGWDFSRTRTLRSVETSLQRLGVDRLDIVQCHDVEWADRAQIVGEALPALRELRDQGVIGAVGVTGYRLAVLEQLATEQQVDTVMAYCTYTLQDRRLTPVAQRLQEAGIGVFNAAPLLLGALTTEGPPSWHPGRPEVLAGCRAAARWCTERDIDLADVALRFALDLPAHSAISSTVVGSETPEILRRNAAALGHPLDPADLAELDRILYSVRDLDLGFEFPAESASPSD